MHPHTLAVLNIGTAIGNSGQHLTLAEIVQACERAGIELCAVEVHDSPSGGERCVIASVWAVTVQGCRRTPPIATEFSGGVLAEIVYLVAVALGQDCIAMHWPNLGWPCGSLIGPAADAWGAFDPSFFLLPGGVPLAKDSAPVPAAA